MGAFIPALLLLAAALLWLWLEEREREKRRLAALAIAKRVMRARGWGQVPDSEQRSVHANPDPTRNFDPELTPDLR